MERSADPLPSKVSGLALLLAVGGAAATVGSLWMTWAESTPDFGASSPEAGWTWMHYGDLLLVVTSVVVVGAVAAMCARPHWHAIGVGVTAVVALECALLGVLVVAALTSLELTDFGTVGYDTGPGPLVAVVGLTVMAAGVITAMIGAAPHDRPLRPHWHLPHVHAHPHT
ncbi:MAG: hypothetical protein JHD16_16485 [Solirubrobacteraceae bacterium]|nr:hypothetical protein [Solirubrobacteraceae bacterium]